MQRKTSMMRPFTVQQVCAARVFLGWTKGDLCQASGLTMMTITNFEDNIYPTSLEVFSAMRKAFLTAGVEFERGDTIGVTVTVQANPWKEF